MAVRRNVERLKVRLPVVNCTQLGDAHGSATGPGLPLSFSHFFDKVARSLKHFTPLVESCANDRERLVNAAMAVACAELCHFRTVEVSVRQECNEFHEMLVFDLTSSIVAVETECPGTGMPSCEAP